MREFIHNVLNSSIPLLPMGTILLLAALVVYKQDQLLGEIGYDSKEHYDLRKQCGEVSEDFDCKVIFKPEIEVTRKE